MTTWSGWTSRCPGSSRSATRSSRSPRSSPTRTSPSSPRGRCSPSTSPTRCSTAMDDWNREHHGASRPHRPRARVADLHGRGGSARRSLSSRRTAPSAASPLCGNSIHQDRRFLARYMPQLDALPALPQHRRQHREGAGPALVSRRPAAAGEEARPPRARRHPRVDRGAALLPRDTSSARPADGAPTDRAHDPPARDSRCCSPAAARRCRTSSTASPPAPRRRGRRRALLARRCVRPRARAARPASRRVPWRARRYPDVAAFNDAAARRARAVRRRPGGARRIPLALPTARALCRPRHEHPPGADSGVLRRGLLRRTACTRPCSRRASRSAAARCTSPTISTTTARSSCRARVPVLDDDTAETLAARVHALEHELYPEAIRLWAEGRLRVEGRRVRILPPRRLDA